MYREISDADSIFLHESPWMIYGLKWLFHTIWWNVSRDFRCRFHLFAWISMNLYHSGTSEIIMCWSCQRNKSMCLIERFHWHFYKPLNYILFLRITVRQMFWTVDRFWRGYLCGEMDVTVGPIAWCIYGGPLQPQRQDPPSWSTRMSHWKVLSVYINMKHNRVC